MPDELTLHPFLWRATHLAGDTSVVCRTPDGMHRYTYTAFGERVRLLAGALQARGIGPGDRVATLGWNTHQHLECYYAVPLIGAQLHTINLRLSPETIGYIIEDAEDRLLFAAADAAGTLASIEDSLQTVTETVWLDATAGDDVPGETYEDLLSSATPIETWPQLSEDLPAGMCYTSGTTGRPKGVEYTHRMIYVHAMTVMTPASLNISPEDVVMPVVPMFHVNSWEFPYAVTMAGAKQVYPGVSPTPEDLISLIAREGVTLTAGVPTVWIDVLEALDPSSDALESLDRIIVGGSAAPTGVMRRYRDEHDVTIEHAWGMTETMSIGSVGRDRPGDAEPFVRASKQGHLTPGMRMRVIADGDDIPWDGESVGELLVRGPNVVDSYHAKAGETAFLEDEHGRWLRTGDIVTVDSDGTLTVVDRVKDVIKSGGEWISSIALENTLMELPEIAEAVVVGSPHARWQERPVAFVVPSSGAGVEVDRVRSMLEAEFPRWWLPDDIIIRSEVPKTATGKFDKRSLRPAAAESDLPFTPGETDT